MKQTLIGVIPLTGRLVVLLVAAIIPAAHAGGQIVRGVVRERDTGVPIQGALVTLDAVETSAGAIPYRGRTASNERGAFSIAARGAGAYRLTVRRIGSRAHSEVLSLAQGAVREVEVILDRFNTLPPVAVVDSSLCVSRGAVGLRVASLWDAARTALSLVVVSAGDTVMGRRLVRYQRTLNPNTREILTESLRSYDERDGLEEPLFTSLSGDSLSRGGYWRATPPLTMEFFAPDAEALLSDAFVRDHCFDLSDAVNGREGLVGLTFEPVRGRPAREIRGTMWLHRETSELQLLEFTWLGLPPVSRHPAVGGEVHYRRLPNGSWIVRRWSLVMPQPGSRLTTQPGTAFGAPDEARLFEEGGLVVVYGEESTGAPGVVGGRVLRATGAALRWAQVRLVGTPFVTTVDSAGRFRFDRVASGPHAIVVQHADFDQIGERVAEQEFLLDEGSVRFFTFRAPTETEMLERVCPGRDERSATVRVKLLDSAQRPVADADLRLHWVELMRTGRDRTLIERMTEQLREVRTDADGSALFCSVSPSLDLTLTLLKNGEQVPLQKMKLNPKQIRVLQVELK